MALQYTTFELATTSSTEDIPTEKLGRRRWSSAPMSSESVASASLLGRNRHPRIDRARSVSSGQVAAIRKRGTTLLMASVSETQAIKLSSMPPPPKVSGVLIAEGKPFKEGQFAKGRSLTLEFTITGKKLQHLFATFELMNLSGLPILTKQVELNPGGIAIDDTVVQSDGYQSITGYVFLLPSETQFQNLAKKVELRYSLLIGNRTTRSHLVESGFVTFFES